MTTYPRNYPQNDYAQMFCRLFVAALILAITVAGVHAVLNHPDTYGAARECNIENNPNVVEFYNPATHRFADVCLTSQGTFGIFVYELVDGVRREVTAFTKEKMKSVEQVLRYLKNAGYGPR